GFFGYAFYERNQDALRPVSIVNSHGKAILPSNDTIESGDYAPFSRPLFIYVNFESLDRVEVEVFVEFFMENIREIVTAANYVPLPDALYAAAVENIENRISGTHYLTDDGDKREGSLVELYVPEN